MTKSGTKPSTGKSNTSTPHQAPKAAATPSVAVRPVAKLVLRPPPKAAQQAQPVPPTKQPVATKRSTPWTVEAASRVYRTDSVKNGGQVSKGSFAAEAMSKATKGAPPPKSR